MSNLIKMNIFRTFKSKSTWINLLFAVIIAIGLFMLSASFGASIASSSDSNNIVLKEITAEQVKQLKEGNGVGFASIEFTQDTKLPLDLCLQNFLSSGMFLIFIGIFITNLVCDREKSRFQKNLSIYSADKWKIALSQNVPLLTFSTIVVIMVSVIYTVCSLIYFDKFYLGDIKNIVCFLGMQIILHYAFGMFIMFIAELTKSKVAAISLTCIFSIGIGTLLLYKLDSVFDIKNFSFVKAVPEYYVKSLPLEFDKNIYINAIVVVLCCALVYNVINAVIACKRDMA